MWLISIEKRETRNSPSSSLTKWEQTPAKLSRYDFSPKFHSINPRNFTDLTSLIDLVWNPSSSTHGQKQKQWWGNGWTSEQSQTNSTQTTSPPPPPPPVSKSEPFDWDQAAFQTIRFQSLSNERLAMIWLGIKRVVAWLYNKLGERAAPIKKTPFPISMVPTTTLFLSLGFFFQGHFGNINLIYFWNFFFLRN